MHCDIQWPSEPPFSSPTALLNGRHPYHRDELVRSPNTTTFGVAIVTTNLSGKHRGALSFTLPMPLTELRLHV